MKAFRLDLLPEQARALAGALQGLVEIGLEDPSIVMPLAAGLEGHAVYLAEEYVAAESLDVALKHYAPAPLERALPLLGQLAGAIDFARARGVGHGALHPRDIFVTPELARATGFGVVQALERLGVRAPVRRPYSAPERVAGATWSTPADVFALAVVAHELLTGKRPAGTGEVAPIVGKAATSHPRLLRAVLTRALAEDPAARYQSAKAFVATLEAAARGEVDESALATASAWTEPSGVEDRPLAPSRELTLELERDLAPARDMGDFDLEPVAPFSSDTEETREEEGVEEEAREPSLLDFAEAGDERGAAPAEPMTTFSRASQAPSTGERGRPALLPFAIVAMVALLAGFVAGYALGSRERGPSAVAGQTPTATPAPAQQAWSEAAVEPPRAETAPPPAPSPSRGAPSVSRGAAAPPVPQEGASTPPTKTPPPSAPAPSVSRGPAPGSSKAPAASLSRGPSPPRGAPSPSQGLGTLVADSRPPGARVVLDGRLVGTTPLKLTNVRAGTYVVRLEMDGYRVWTTEITIAGARATRVAGSLERMRNR